MCFLRGMRLILTPNNNDRKNCQLNVVKQFFFHFSTFNLYIIHKFEKSNDKCAIVDISINSIKLPYIKCLKVGRRNMADTSLFFNKPRI